MKESDIQRQITDWLTLHRYFWYRQNSGAMAGSHKGKRWFVRFAKPGAPDIVCVINGIYVGIEVKNERGEQSQAQVDFEHELRRAGGIYVLARSLNDVIKVCSLSVLAQGTS